MRALVVGGTGFIGAWITAQLLERGDQVVVLHRGRRAATDLPGGAISVVSAAPLSRLEPYHAALRHGEPDAVIHVLALVEADGLATRTGLSGRAGRLVLLSSGDVYRAYGRFTGQEPGPIEPTPLDPGASPLRERRYPYRTPSTEPGSMEYDYDKILVERALTSIAALPSVILRLPKVFGVGGNADFSSVYGFAGHPQWRWTHGYVENVAAAAVLAATHPAAPGRIYNVGEAYTPTVAERLAHLPRGQGQSEPAGMYNFDQDIAYDTSPIRRELGYSEPVSYDEAICRTLA